MSDRVTIFVVDDDADVRRSLQLMLCEHGYDVVEFSSAKEFLDVYEPVGIGCILLDIVMPGVNGLEVIDRLSEIKTAHPIVAMTGQADVPMATCAFESGAFAFIEKPFRRDALIERITNAVRRDMEVRKQCLRRDELQARFAQLTQRERQVLELVVDGKLTKQIAVQLGISQRTVETHRGNIMTKARAESLAELLSLAVEARDYSRRVDYDQATERRPWRGRPHDSQSRGVIDEH